MGKVKQANGKAAKAADPLASAKKAGVTKAADSPKVKSKQLAKDLATKMTTKDKKKKKVESSSESETDSDDDEESSASDDSDDDSDDASSDSSEDDSDSDSSESEAETKKKAAPKTNGKAAPKVNGKAESKPLTNGKAKKAAESDSSDSSDSSDEEEDSDSDDSENDKKDATKKAKVAVSGGAKVKQDSDSDSSGSSEDDSDDSDSSDDSEAEKAEAPKKRKAEEETAAPSKKNKTDAAPSEDEYNTLFVGNLSWNIDDDALYEAFKDCDGLSTARVVTDKAMQRSRGFGYVDFENYESAKAAFESMNGFELDGRPLRLDPSKPRPAEGDSNPNARAQQRAQQHGDNVSPESDTLFVGNLPFDADEEMVSEFFNEVCEVKSLRLPTDQYVHFLASKFSS
ncbi:hypothetical protein F4780DRAFT_119223 [Xylariomycetidae sp. FL0641]|nr:hypothetical protein F4780DRAFT_119223 [Xylariomycetidae sp. FL0641]